MGFFHYSITFNDESSGKRSQKQSKGTYRVLLSIGRHAAIYYNSFGIGYIHQKVLNIIKDKYITHNIFRIQDDDCIICRFYCIAFIKYMIPGKTLLDYTNIFSPNDYKKKDKIIYMYFKDKYEKRKCTS